MLRETLRLMDVKQVHSGCYTFHVTSDFCQTFLYRLVYGSECCHVSTKHEMFWFFNRDISFCEAQNNFWRFREQLRTVTITIVLSVRQSAGIGPTPAYWIFCEITRLGFLPKFPNTFKLMLQYEQNDKHFIGRPTYDLISCYEAAWHLRHPSSWGTYNSRMYNVDHRA